MDLTSSQISTSAPLTSEIKLLRLADMLQEIFYMYRKRTFDSGLKNIDYMDGIMRTYDSLEASLPIEKLLDKCDGTNDEKTLLARYGCTQAVALMADILMLGLTGMNCQVVAVLAKMKDPHRKFIRIDQDGLQDFGDPDHEFFKITLLDETPHHITALDLSIAQYGYYKPLVLFQEYVEERVLVLKREDSLAEAKRSYLELEQADTEGGRIIRKRIYAESVGFAVGDWQRRERIKVKEVIGLPEEEFCIRRESLLEFLQKTLTETCF